MSIIRNDSNSKDEIIAEIRKHTIATYTIQQKGNDNPTSGDLIWKAHEPLALRAADGEQEWINRLKKDDVTDEVKKLEQEYRKLCENMEMYKNGDEFVMKSLKELLGKFDEATLKKYQEIRNINLIVQDNSKQVGERIVDIRKLPVHYVRKKMGKESEKVTDVEVWRNQVPRLNSLVNKNDQWMIRLKKDDVNDKVNALEAEIRKLDQVLDMYTKEDAFVEKTLKEVLEKFDEDTLKKYTELRHEIFA